MYFLPTALQLLSKKGKEWELLKTPLNNDSLECQPQLL